MARFGQILRASDCPADAVVNRRATIDCPAAGGRPGDPRRPADVGSERRSGGGGPADLRRLVRRAPDLHAAGRPGRRAGRGAGRVCSRSGGTWLRSSSTARWTCRGSSAAYTRSAPTAPTSAGGDRSSTPRSWSTSGDLTGEVTMVNATAAESVVVRTHTHSITAVVLRSPSAADAGRVIAPGAGSWSCAHRAIRQRGADPRLSSLLAGEGNVSPGGASPAA